LSGVRKRRRKKRNEKANKALRVYMKDSLWLTDNRRKYDRQTRKRRLESLEWVHLLKGSC